MKTIKHSNLLAVLFFAAFTLGIYSCNKPPGNEEVKTNTISQKISPITEDEVVKAQQDWGDGIVKIGLVYVNKGDYKEAATEHIQKFYNYNEGSVLFKPTLASEKQFRTDFEGALSYFIGKNLST